MHNGPQQKVARAIKTEKKPQHNHAKAGALKMTKLFFIVEKEKFAIVLQNYPDIADLIGEVIQVHTKEQFEQFQSEQKSLDKKTAIVIIVHSIAMGESTRDAQHCAIRHDIKALGFINVQSGNVARHEEDDLATSNEIKALILKKIAA